MSVNINFAPELMNAIVSGDKIKIHQDWCGGLGMEDYLGCLNL